jgi:hypothetical protein
MKKLFIYALVAGSLLMASCGGSAKKAEESKAVVYAKNFVDLELKGDYQGMQLVNAEMDKYISTLSYEEQAKFVEELSAEVDKYVSTLPKEEKVIFEDMTEVSVIIYHTGLAVTENALAAKLVGEWSGAEGTLTLNKDGKFLHHIGHSATLPMVLEGSWRVDCSENQKCLILKYDFDEVLTFTINGETLEGVGDSEGETYTRL